MSTFAKVMAVLLVVLAAVAFSGVATPSRDDKRFAAKVEDLTAGKESRADKVVAIHAFVRDEIVQSATQYG